MRADHQGHISTNNRLKEEVCHIQRSLIYFGDQELPGLLCTWDSVLVLKTQC